MQVFILWAANHTTSLFDKNLAHRSILQWLPAPRSQFICEGKLYKPVERREEGETLWIDLQLCKRERDADFSRMSGKVVLRTFQKFHDDLMAGDTVRFKTSLKLPRDFKNPGSFSSTAYYQSLGVDAQGFISDPIWVVRLQSDKKAPFQRWFETIRKRVRQGAVENGPPTSSAFLLGLLTGERKEMGQVWEENFKRAGVSHILSISGLHVAMVALLFLFLFRIILAAPFGSRSIPRLRLYPLAVIPFIWLYVAVAGFPIPALRAALAATFFLVGLSFWRKMDLLSALALAAFLILSFSPHSLFQASFQLSFVAVLFLIFTRSLTPRELSTFPSRGAWHLVRYFFSSLSISFITLLGLAPILLYHFHEISLMGIAANLIVVPLVNFLVMPLGMAGWILSGLLGFDIAWIWKGADGFASLTLHLVSFFADHADALLFFGAIKIWQIPFYYAVIWVCFLPKTVLQGKRKLALALGLMAVFSTGYMFPKTDKLKVTFLDVGQGDCAIIELPNKKVWVMDGGGIKGSDWDIGRYVVAPYLWEKGIHQIDRLFLSHPHHDHYKGLKFLAEHFSPKVLFTNGDDAPEAEGEEWQEFLSAIKKKKVEVTKVTSQTKPIEEGGVLLQFFAPGPNGTIPHFDTNDNSVVMKLTYKNVAFLFPGDLMEEGENLLMEHMVAGTIRSDVLKLGHHGSDTSTTDIFLDAVKPQYAIISAGLFNEYGVPDEPVLERLKNRGIRILRTDRQGAITFASDGQKVQIKTFVGKGED